MLILTMTAAWACSPPGMPRTCDERFPTARMLSERTLIPPTSTGTWTLPENTPLLFHVPPDYYDEWRASLAVRTTWQGSQLPVEVDYEAPIAKVWLTEAFTFESAVEVRYRQAPDDETKWRGDIVAAPAIDIDTPFPELESWAPTTAVQTWCGEPTDEQVDVLDLQSNTVFGTVLVESDGALQGFAVDADASGTAAYGVAPDEPCTDFVPQLSDPLTLTVVDRFGNRSEPVSIDAISSDSSDGDASTGIGANAGCGCASASTPSVWGLLLLALPMLRFRRR